MINSIQFDKNNGLVPVIIQNAATRQVLMQGYMNREAFQKTREDGIVTFYSRSKERLWTKGETSGNYLYVRNIQLDCDNDSLLISAEPKGPTCHLGTNSCFEENTAHGFLYQLEQTIRQRINNPSSESYTAQLMQKGVNKVAQKVGEEATELVIESKDDDKERFKNEAADLLYHYLILLKTKNLDIKDVEEVLLERNDQSHR